MSALLSQLFVNFRYTYTLKYLPSTRLLPSTRITAFAASVSNYSTIEPRVVSDAKIDAPASSKQLPSAGFLPHNLPKALYGGRHSVAMLLGDGVGPELMGHVKSINRLLGAPIEFEEVEINNKTDDRALEEAILAVKRNGIGIKGNLETLPNQTSKNLVIREALSLSTFVQRCYSFPGVTTRHDNIDIVIIRENTEGEYSRLEHENVPGVVESLKIITAKKSRKVAQFAFEYAVKHKRRLVTAVHKANIMKLSDGLFLNVCSEVAKSFPQIEFNSMIIDNCCMQLVSRPHQFDMMVLPNLYGNIVGNVAAGLVGGPGLACGMNLGDKHALFETGTRNSGRSLVGKNVANPFAILLTNADMLGYLEHPKEADAIRKAIFKVSQEDRLHTIDLGGSCSTLEVVDGIKHRIEEQMI